MWIGVDNMPRLKSIYAMYKGEEFIASGTLEELAALKGIKVESVFHYTTECYRKRMNGKNSTSVVKLGTTKELGEL